MALARRLPPEAAALESRCRLRFEPDYPGVTQGVEGVRGGLRLVLACWAYGGGDEPMGVVFTALIAGRRPVVSVAPAPVGIPEGWRSLADFS